MASEERLGRIEFLDFAKGFAILGVVLYHYLSSSTSGVLQRATQLGGAGVHLFLMLAGFGLALASAPVSWGAFYRRRFVRILVPYYLVVTVLFVVNLFRPYFPGDGLYAYAGHIFLFKMFDGRIFMSFGSVFWFISVLVALFFATLNHRDRAGFWKSMGKTLGWMVLGSLALAYLMLWTGR